jgi:hypothetical protein
MVIKDKVVDWYLRNVFLSKTEVINSPGYICEHLGKQKDVFLREIAVPEDMLVDIEKSFPPERLYCIGKKFGYRYALLSDFPTIKGSTKDEFMSNAYFLVRYMESVSYGKRIEHTIDYEKRVFRIVMDDYVICRKSGLGYLFSSGGVGGLWSYVISDPGAEGVQTRCQGKGDKKCEVMCAPSGELKKLGLSFFRATETKDLGFDPAYGRINQIRGAKYAKNSLKDSIDSGFFRYTHGMITYKDQRLFLCEASFLYILEKELGKKGSKKLFDLAFSWGRKLASSEKKQGPENFMMDFLPALGWGDMLVRKTGSGYEVLADLFPWTKWYKDIDYSIFRGLVSGMISGFTGKKTELKRFELSLSGSFSILCKE